MYSIRIRKPVFSQSKNSQGETTKTVIFPKEVCQLCSRRGECTEAKNTGRTIRIGPNEEYLQKMRARQKTEEFKEIYNQRRPQPETSTHREKDR